MKKIPLLTIIFFYLSLVPVLLFLIAWGICISYGDPDEIFEAIILIFAFFPVTRILAPVIIFLQIAAIVNYCHARKQVRENQENHIDEE